MNHSTPSELVSSLRDLDVKIWAEGDKLRYSAPRGALTPTLRDQLSEHKAEVLTLLREASEAQLRLPPIRPVPHAGYLPLSFGQESLWFLEQLTPGTSSYNLAFSQHWRQVLDTSALERSLTEIVRRHETLRAMFATVNGQPVQRIAPSAPFQLSVIDLRTWPLAEREAEAQRHAEAEARRPFDLARGQLLRATLLQLADDDYQLIVVVHHIVFDGSSSAVMKRELWEIYRAFALGRSSPLSELPIQYADYVDWQRNYLSGNVRAQQLDYWKQQLTGPLPVLDLPTDRPRPTMQTFRGARRSFELSPALLTSLTALARQTGTTLFMILNAAFNTLLYRYTGQDDILIGTPIVNRRRAELEQLIGFFVNVLVLRTDLSNEPTFRELLGRVRETSLDAYAHQDLPIEVLVEALQPQRDLSRPPLFQVMFVLEPARRIVEAIGTGTEVDTGASKYDLTLYLWEHEGALGGAVEYNTDLFDADRIDRLIGHLQTLLAAIVIDPDQRISHLPILTAAEQQQLLTDWNNTARDYPRQTIQQLFEAQVARTPDAVAVMSDLSQITFRELNAHANRVAHYLQALGVVAETTVAICLPRSPDLIVCLLGILKAGGAYVPLDPAYPKERLAFMLKDSRASILLTQRELADRFPAPDAQVVYLDAGTEAIAQQPTENPNIDLPLDALAYVTYTSGSTGAPKGVQGLQRGAVNRFNWMWHAYPFQPGEVCCQKTYLSFVDSVWEIFGPLLHGIPIVIIPDPILKDDQLLIQTLADCQVTRIVLAPSLLRVLLAKYDDLQLRLPRLKYWSSSGEALPLELAQRFGRVMPNAILLNLYGSSEAAADSVVYQVKPGAALKTMLIGRPIDNTVVYLLDAHCQPVPIGVTGEIYIGGDGLARGYHHRPDLSAERFIPNRLAVPARGAGQAEGNARLYKTGDLGRYSPDGNIEYLGRIDHQVKIRGFRIELGEIEATLKHHPDVLEAVVVAREESPGDTRLVAYVVRKDSARRELAGDEVRQLSSPSAAGSFSADLRGFLKDKLPDYMVPAVYVVMDALPLTPSGKIDRRALPEPDTAQVGVAPNFVAPRNVTERQLSTIWEEVLHVRPVGVCSNFFELGGHSLLAIEMFAQIEKIFSNRLPLTTLFQSPTIEQLAKVLCNDGCSDDWSTLVAIQPGGRQAPFFCVHGFGGGVLDYGELALLLGPEQPFYGLQARGVDGDAPPHDRIEEMAAYYIDAIQTVQPRGPYYLGGYCYGGVVAFEMARQLRARGESVALVGVFEGYAPVRTKERNALWRSRALINFIHNLPYWLRDYLQLGRAQVVARVRTKLRSVVHKVIHPPGHSPEVQLADYLPDVSKIPLLHQKMMEVQLHAIRRYQPGPYDGRVTLFRVRAMSLFHAADPEMGWGKLAVGGVKIRMIGGGHNTILEQPHVQSLAEQLKASIQEAQPPDINHDAL